MYWCAPCRICRFVSNLWRLLHLFGKRDVSIGKCALGSKKLKKWKIGRIPMEDWAQELWRTMQWAAAGYTSAASYPSFLYLYFCICLSLYFYICVSLHLSNRWAAGHKAAASLPSRSGQARCGGQQSGARSHQHRLLALRHPGLGVGMMIQHIQPIPSIT